MVRALESAFISGGVVLGVDYLFIDGSHVSSWQQMAQSLLTATILLGFIAVIGCFVISLIKALKGTGNPKAITLRHTEEENAFQQVQQGVARIEQRMDTMETILADREAREPHRASL
jgi:hypothetical protein